MSPANPAPRTCRLGALRCRAGVPSGDAPQRTAAPTQFRTDVVDHTDKRGADVRLELRCWPTLTLSQSVFGRSVERLIHSGHLFSLPTSKHPRRPGSLENLARGPGGVGPACARRPLRDREAPGRGPSRGCRRRTRWGCPPGGDCLSLRRCCCRGCKRKEAAPRPHSIQERRPPSNDFRHASAETTPSANRTDVRRGGLVQAALRSEPSRAIA